MAELSDEVRSASATVGSPDLALDLRFLKSAFVVAEQGSFRRAANVLNLSQSTVSRRVQLLERRLGLALFERSRGGARLSHAGAQFIRDAAFGAGHLQRAVADVGLMKRGSTGELRIGVMASLGSGFLADLFYGFHARFPDVDVKLEEATSEANATGVLRGRLDIAFVPGAAHFSGCEVRHLWDEELYVALPTRHRLAAGETVAWEQLCDETFLVAADVHGPEIEGIIIRHVSRLGFFPKISVQRVGRENPINMVGRGYGLTLAAKSTLGATYPRGHICSDRFRVRERQMERDMVAG